MHDLTVQEKIALSRDGFGRDDVDKLLNGFFPAWAVAIYIIAGNF